MSRKPYMNGSYKEMMKRIPSKATDAPHSEGKKPYMNENYNQMEEFYFGQLSPWKFDMGNINFSSDFDFGDMGDMGDGAIVSEGDCDTAWKECREKLPSSCIGCGLPQMAEDCMNEKGFHMTGAGSNPNNLPECKEHKDILSCLHYNSLCWCLACQENNKINCNQPFDEECYNLVEGSGLCSDKELCPPFELEGADSCPAYLCPTTEICASDIVGGDAIGKCIYVPCEGCGTKTVTVTDICGNIVKKKVRMSVGAWYSVGFQSFTPCDTNLGDFIRCQANPSYCECYIISGDTQIWYRIGQNNNTPCSVGNNCPGNPCSNCTGLGSYPLDATTYEWRC